MVVAADNVRDAHQGVVDGDHVVVNRDTGRNSAGGADEDRIADGGGGELDRPAGGVVKAQGMVLNAEPDGKMFAGGEVVVDLIHGKRAATPGVDLRAMLGDRQVVLGF